MALIAATPSDALLTLQQGDDGTISLTLNTPDGNATEIAYFCDAGGLHIAQLNGQEVDIVDQFIQLDGGALSVVLEPLENNTEGSDTEQKEVF